MINANIRFFLNDIMRVHKVSLFMKNMHLCNGVCVTAYKDDKGGEKVNMQIDITASCSKKTLS